MLQESYTPQQIRKQIDQLGVALNEDRMDYKRELHKLLDVYFASMTRDADEVLRAMEAYTEEIEMAHQQHKMSEKEYALHSVIMWLVQHNQEDFCNRVYFD